MELPEACPRGRCELVVAWYKEDVSWIRQRGFESSTTLYAKGGGDVEARCSPSRTVELPNVGREGHTYLAHILQNYDDLADVTFFLQGDPVFHCPQIFDLVDRQRDANGASEEFPPMMNPGKLYTVHDFHCHYWSQGRCVMQKMYRELFVDGAVASSEFTFGSGAIMSVTRDGIRARSLAFWQRCMSYVDHHVDPQEGYALERIWGLLFDVSNVARPDAELSASRAPLPDAEPLVVRAHPSSVGHPHRFKCQHTARWPFPVAHLLATAEASDAP